MYVSFAAVMVNTMTENFVYGIVCYDLQTVAPLTEDCNRINGMVIPEHIKQLEQVIRPNGEVRRRSSLGSRQQPPTSQHELTRRISDRGVTLPRVPTSTKDPSEQLSDIDEDQVTSVSASSLHAESDSQRKTTTRRERRASYSAHRGGAGRGGAIAGRGGAVAGRGGAVARRGGAVAAGRGGSVAAGRGGAVAGRGGGGRSNRRYPIDALIASQAPNRSNSVDLEDDQTSSESEQHNERGRGTGRKGKGRGRTGRQSNKSSNSPLPCPEQDYGHQSDGENIDPDENILAQLRKKTVELNKTKVHADMMTGQATIAAVRSTFGNTVAKEYEAYLKCVNIAPEPNARRNGVAPVIEIAPASVVQNIPSAAARGRGRGRSEVAPAVAAPSPAALDEDAEVLHQLQQAAERNRQTAEQRRKIEAEQRETSLVAERKRKLQSEMYTGRASISEVHVLFGPIIGTEYEKMKTQNMFGDCEEDKNDANDQEVAAVDQENYNDVIQNIHQAAEQRRKVAAEQHKAALVTERKRKLQSEMTAGRASISEVHVLFGPIIGTEYEKMKAQNMFGDCNSNKYESEDYHHDNPTKYMRREEQFDDVGMFRRDRRQQWYKQHQRVQPVVQFHKPKQRPIEYARALSYMAYNDSMNGLNED